MQWLTDFSDTLQGQMSIAAIAMLIFFAALGIMFRHKKMSVKEITYSAMLLALAVALSFISFSMPQGGSATPGSMFFIILVGIWFGLPMGLVAGLTFGLLRLAINPFFFHPIQVMLDYILGYGALGFGALFFRNKNFTKLGFINKYTLAIVIPILLRLTFSTISGYVFFAEWAPEGWNPLVYSIAYNSWYMLAEMAFILILLSFPQFRQAVDHVKSRIN